MDERTALIGLSLVPRVTARIGKQLLEHFGSAVAICHASEEELRAAEGITSSVAHAVVAAQLAVPQQAAQMIVRTRELKARVIALCDPDYPERLTTIYDPPLALYVRGTLVPDDALAVAIVGARQTTPYGIDVAEQFAAGLAIRGITVVSGMARGIDGVAHQATLRAGGRTIAVLGGGLARLYPREHAKLAEAIAFQGAVISEFPPDTRPNPAQFPQRNRIISGLSLGVIVIEASEKSGALITASCAAEQGRDVLAVPGKITSATSAGTHGLIKDGAALVTNVNDVCEALRLEVQAPVSTCSPAPVSQGLAPDARQLWDVLSDEPVHVDLLAATLRLDMTTISSLLLQLELEGWIRQWPGQRYTRRQQLEVGSDPRARSHGEG